MPSMAKRPRSRSPRAVFYVFILCLSLFSLFSFWTSTPFDSLKKHPVPRHNLPVNVKWSPNTPEFCERLIKKPAPYDLECGRDGNTPHCPDGTVRMFGDMSQDYYLYTSHFVHLKRRGVFFDVATNEPIKNSNTYFFEKCLGWSGLCVEANPFYFAPIHRHRGCALVPTCVSDRDAEQVEFQLAAELGGIKKTNKHNVKWERNDSVPPSIVQRCTTLEREAQKYDVSVVDYFSLDVEGHELHVLKGIDWDRLVINVFTVEAPLNQTGPFPFELFLLSKGYVRHTPTLNEESMRTGLLTEDMVFHRKDVVWGEPK